jgi:hypothetical protein
MAYAAGPNLFCTVITAGAVGIKTAFTIITLYPMGTACIL